MHFRIYYPTPTMETVIHFLKTQQMQQMNKLLYILSSPDVTILKASFGKETTTER